jgi:transposase
MKAKADYTSKEFLYEEYVIKDKSLLQLANELKVSISTLQRWLRKHKIYKGFA